MALLFPTALPLAVMMASGETEIVFSVTGAILTGAIFGDHCSPISDTTIMASMSCKVNHIDHVRTQLPYALLIGSVSLVLGYLPSGFHINPFVLMALQLAVIIVIFRYLGKSINRSGE